MAARMLVVHLSAMAIPIMSVIFLLMTISDCKRRMRFFRGHDCLPKER